MSLKVLFASVGGLAPISPQYSSIYNNRLAFKINIKSLLRRRSNSLNHMVAKSGRLVVRMSGGWLRWRGWLILLFISPRH